MKFIRKYLVWGLVVILVSGVIFKFWQRWVDIRVVDQTGNVKIKIYPLGINLYLFLQNYKSQYRTIKFSYVTEEQDNVALFNGDQGLVQSMGFIKKGSKLDIKIHYAPKFITEVLSSPGWVDVDVYAALCLALDPNKPDREGCYRKGYEYYQKTMESKLKDAVKVISKRLSLVGEVMAGCQGTIYCGRMDSNCTCSVGGGICTTSGSDCGPYNSGTCECVVLCNVNAGAMACSSVDDQSSCNSASANDCAVGCNPSDATPCNWVCVPSSWSVCSEECNGTQTSNCGNTRSCGTCGSDEHCNANHVCKPNCDCTSPTSPTLISPSSGSVYYNHNGLTVAWEAPINWGDECDEGYGRKYNVCLGTNPVDPCNGGSIITVTNPTAVIGLNSIGTFYWKVIARNDCDMTSSSPIWSVVNNGLLKTCALTASNYVAEVGTASYVGSTGTVFNINMTGNANSTSNNVRQFLNLETPICQKKVSNW